jgi:ABC-type sugar transport system ATPase subunit
MTSAISLKNVRVSVGHKTLIDQINLEIPAG